MGIQDQVYLKKTLQHFDSLDPGCLGFNDHPVHFARRFVFQALEQFSSICNRLNWCNSTQVLGVLKRCVHSRWLWIAPLIAPLQKHLDEVRRMTWLVWLYVPGWLSKPAALAVNVLGRRTAGALLHLANSSTVEGWISGKWRYAGHVLRMPEQSPALRAFRYGELGNSVDLVPETCTTIGLSKSCVTHLSPTSYFGC